MANVRLCSKRALAAAICLACAACEAQTVASFTAPAHLTSNGTPTSSVSALSRIENTDADTGIHYVRLSISLPIAGNGPDLAPHFTLECRDVKGKHDLFWFLSFGGVSVQPFMPPTNTAHNASPADYPQVKLKMDFEGYMRTKPYTRAWEALPSGEFRFCNASMNCPNMETARNYMSYLNALPTLRISFAKSSGVILPEQVFQLQSLVDEANKTPLCSQ